MKTIKRFFLSTAAVTAALITGCTPEEEHMPVQGGTGHHPCGRCVGESFYGWH